MSFNNEINPPEYIYPEGNVIGGRQQKGKNKRGKLKEHKKSEQTKDEKEKEKIELDNGKLIDVEA